jgi:lysophospholipase L1-like esterase
LRATLAVRRLIAALSGACLAAACGDSSSTLSPTSGPKLTCPAPVSQASPSGGAAAVVYQLPTVSGGVPPLFGPLCTPPTGSTFPPGINTVACTVTDSQAHSDLCTFTVTVTASPKLSVTLFDAFGDSMTWGEDGRNVPTDPTNARIFRILPQLQVALQYQYPQVLQMELQARYTTQAASIRVDNHGHPGEPIVGAFTDFTTDMAAASYGALLLMDGANDLANANSNPATASQIEAQAIAGLSQMIDYAAARRLKVFLATLPPENPNGCCPSDRGTPAALVPGFNAMIQTLAASKGAVLVDIYGAFNNDLSLISPDGLHPNINGYHLIADTFFAAIRSTLETGAPTTTTKSPPVRSPAMPAIRRP